MRVTDGVSLQRAEDVLDQADLVIVGWIPQIRFVRVRPKSADASLDDVLLALSGAPELSDIAINAPFYPASDCDLPTVAPNDPYYANQWQWQYPPPDSFPGDIDAESAWVLSTGDSKVKVGVLDFGFNLSHSQLVNRFGAGYDCVAEDTNPSGGNPHGMHVAGLIGAEANDGLSVAGLDWAATLTPIKIGNTIAYAFDVAQGIIYAASSGCAVINMSLSGPSPVSIVDAALDYAAAKGATSVAAAGNSGTAGVQYPASHESVIAVGWSDGLDALSPQSPHGPKLSCVAPGVNVVTVNAEADWFANFASGSSYSCAIVSGIVALMIAAKPEASVEQLKAALLEGCEDQVGPPALDTPGWDKYYGWGRVNAYRSLSILLDHGLIDGGLSAGTETIDPTQDWQLDLCLDAGAGRGAHVYWLFANLSGAGVTNDLGFATIPLASDPLLRISLDHPNSGLLGQNLGLLDGDGRGSVTIAAPAGAAVAGSGLDLSMCYVTLDPKHMADGPTYTSEVVAVAIE